jgi:hypothetical protein
VRGFHDGELRLIILWGLGGLLFGIFLSMSGEGVSVPLWFGLFGVLFGCGLVYRFRRGSKD